MPRITRSKKTRKYLKSRTERPVPMTATSDEKRIEVKGAPRLGEYDKSAKIYKGERKKRKLMKAAARLALNLSE